MGRHAAHRSFTGRRLAVGGALAAAGLLAAPGLAFAGDAPCPDEPATSTPEDTGQTPEQCDPLLTVSGALDATVCLDLDASAAGQTVTVD